MDRSGLNLGPSGSNGDTLPTVLEVCLLSQHFYLQKFMSFLGSVSWHKQLYLLSVTQKRCRAHKWIINHSWKYCYIWTSSNWSPSSRGHSSESPRSLIPTVTWICSECHPLPYLRCVSLDGLFNLYQLVYSYIIICTLYLYTIIHISICVCVCIYTKIHINVYNIHNNNVSLSVKWW